MDLTRAKRISGWMNDKELEYLASVAEKSNISVEIGSYYGRSCRAIADNTSGIVYAIDPYKGEYKTENQLIRLDFDDETLAVFKYNLSDHLESGKVIHFRGIFPEFNPGIKVDFIFIDGDHSYEGCLADIKHAVSMIKPGGIIAGHDYGTPGFTGVDKSVQEIFPREYIKVIETIWTVTIPDVVPA